MADTSCYKTPDKEHEICKPVVQTNLYSGINPNKPPPAPGQINEIIQTGAVYRGSGNFDTIRLQRVIQHDPVQRLHRLRTTGHAPKPVTTIRTSFRPPAVRPAIRADRTSHRRITKIAGRIQQTRLQQPRRATFQGVIRWQKQVCRRCPMRHHFAHMAGKRCTFNAYDRASDATTHTSII
jgi:hypothetical protein